MGKFSFKGVIGRKTFIISYLLMILGIVAVLGTAVQLEYSEYHFTSGILGLILVALTVYSFQLVIQRTRDIGLSLWLSLCIFIPYVNTAYLLYLAVAKKDSQKERLE